MIENPVLTKEMRSRMRGVRGPIIQLAYVALIIALSAIMYSIFKADQARRGRAGYGTAQSADFGHALFLGISTLQISMVCLLAPAFTAGAISAEHEQRSLDMLLVTKLKPRAILLGKLGSALGYVGLLIISSAPILSVCFMFGGVAPDELVGTYALLATTGIFFGLTGLFWSCVFRRTMQATAAAYATVAILCIVVTVADFLVYEMTRYQVNDMVFSYLNPIMGVVSVTEWEEMSGEFLFGNVPVWAVTLSSQILAMPVLLVLSTLLLRRRQ
ncbi:MAG: ABC transporter permease [Armatimonadota bacterium]